MSAPISTATARQRDFQPRGGPLGIDINRLEDTHNNLLLLVKKGMETEAIDPTQSWLVLERCYPYIGNSRQVLRVAIVHSVGIGLTVLQYDSDIYNFFSNQFLAGRAPLPAVTAEEVSKASEILVPIIMGWNGAKQ